MTGVVYKKGGAHAGAAAPWQQGSVLVVVLFSGTLRAAVCCQGKSDTRCWMLLPCCALNDDA